MRLRDAAALAAVNLRKNPVRTMLTILGLGVGIGAILTVLTLGIAGERQVRTEIGRLGVDKLWVSASQTDGSPLPEDSGRILREVVEVPCCAEAVTGAIASLGERTALCRICGYDAGLTSVYGVTLTQGRLLAAREYESGAACAMLDTTAAEALGAAPGDWVCAGTRMVRVVGVIEPITSDLFSGAQGSVLLPIATFLDTWGGHGVDRVTICAPEDGDYDRVEAAAAAALDEGVGRYTVQSMRREIDAVQQVVRIFVMVLACVAAVCMLTGSIGVMNILLVSVRERRREIGLIKAVGGTAGQVAVLFLMEAVCYALLGGALGLVLGMAMIRLFGAWIGLEAALGPGTALPTLGGACLLGIGFGVAPAMRAAGMQPVDALRRD